MKRNERHNCPYCDDEIVFKDEQGHFWAKQHLIQDCMNIIKKKKDDFRDALKKTQEQLGQRDEELFVAQQKVKTLEAELEGRRLAHVLTETVGLEGIKAMTDVNLDALLKETLAAIPSRTVGPIPRAPEPGIPAVPQHFVWKTKGTE